MPLGECSVNKILIANRGEIACRVMRSARALGARTVAVYSDADRESLHVATADEAVHIGPSKAAESYLNIDALLAAAAATGHQRRVVVGDALRDSTRDATRAAPCAAWSIASSADAPDASAWSSTVSRAASESSPSSA